MMFRQAPMSPLRLQRFALAVALVVLLRVVAWDLHHVLDIHADTGERCQACLVMERGGDGPAPTAAVAPQCPAGHAPAPLAGGHLPAVPAPGPLPRGPPSSFS